jgi:radical SAM protein with 4Fe4S-binding SPASM domain
MEHKELSNRCIIEAMATAERLGIPLAAPTPFTLDNDTSTPKALPTPPPPPPRARGAHEAAPPDWAPDAFWCKFAWREVFVSIGGELAPCCHQERPVMGNVFTDDWDEIWNGEEYQALRRGLRDKKPRSYCASCSLLAEQGKTKYSEKNYLFEDRYPDQTTADQRPSWSMPKPEPE